jgi:hypothetical protein
MAISEASRHEMHTKLEEVLGAQVAATMMEHLPPVGWADVATKHDLEMQTVLMKRDLDTQTALLDGRFERVELQFRSELRGEINRLMLWQFPTMVTLLALAFAAAKLS